MTAQPSDLGWLRQLSGELAALGDPAEISRWVVEALTVRFDSPITTHSELSRGPTAHTPLSAAAGMVDQLWNRLDQHPLFGPVTLLSRAGPAAPVAISEVLGVGRWRSHPIYNEILRPGGVPLHTLCIPVTRTTDGRFTWYQVNRDRDFTRRELDLFCRLQPVLIALAPPAADPVVLPGPRLTTREAELLFLLAEGITVAAAARRLGIAGSTAAKHLEHIHHKLDTHGPVDTIRRATELGLVPRAQGGRDGSGSSGSFPVQVALSHNLFEKPASETKQQPG